MAKKEVFGHEVGNLKVVRLLDLLKVCGLGPRSLIEMFDRTHGRWETKHHGFRKILGNSHMFGVLLSI